MGSSSLEDVKADSGHLAGTIGEELSAGTGAFEDDTTQVLKFHGVYQQDDRDVRRERLRAGEGRAYSCMVRASIPGGVLSADQYLACDELIDRVGGTSMRVTTRQGLQWHFVAQQDLRPLIAGLNEQLVTTLAACGDVARNTMACPAPLPGRDTEQLHADARALAAALYPRSDSYWTLWVDGERAVEAAPPVGDLDGPEPLYGDRYLPRKFKIAFAPGRDNCVDALSQDIGIVPVHRHDGIAGYTLLVGGGLGMSHNRPETFPRLADALSTIDRDELVEVVAAIVAVQRDHGDRSDRAHARMKYLVHDWGLAHFRAAVEDQLGRPLPPVVEEPDWSATDDHLGWHDAADGTRFLGVRLPAGRITDRDGARLRTALREAAARFASEVRFTPRQDVLLVGIDPDAAPAVDRLLAGHGVAAVDELAAVERTALACPALPTCGLALAEAERVLDPLVVALHDVLAAEGLADEPLHVRVTGCPNGCSRPYSTEVGIVGRGRDHYSLFLGGSATGDRLGRRWADRVARAEVPQLLRPLLAAWRDDRRTDETFGDWCDRRGVAGWPVDVVAAAATADGADGDVDGRAGGLDLRELEQLAGVTS